MLNYIYYFDYTLNISFRFRLFFFNKYLKMSDAIGAADPDPLPPCSTITETAYLGSVVGPYP